MKGANARGQVGVDLNAVVGSTWRAAPLPFIAGLGPRKAAALVRTVLQKHSVACRKELWDGLGRRYVFRCLHSRGLFCAPPGF